MISSFGEWIFFVINPLDCDCSIEKSINRVSCSFLCVFFSSLPNDPGAWRGLLADDLL